MDSRAFASILFIVSLLGAFYSYGQSRYFSGRRDQLLKDFKAFHDILEMAKTKDEKAFSKYLEDLKI